MKDVIKSLPHYRVLEQLPDDYVQKLHDYLLENCDAFFNEPSNKADSELDMDRFPSMTTDRNHLVKYGELMLVDLEDRGTGEDLGYRFQMGHCYFICSVRKSEDRQVTKIHRVIDIRNEIQKKHWRNGYFLLPKL